MISPQSSWLERTGAIIALTIVGVYAFTVIMPYYLPPVTNPELIQLLDRSKGTVDTVTVAVVMFFFGGTVGRRMQESTMEKQASTLQAAQAALAPVPPTVTLEPGESATVQAEK
jgi:hypothetical protein